jgi:FkbM family methyltransferase
MKRYKFISLILILILILIIPIFFTNREGFYTEPYLDILRIKKIEHEVYGSIYVFDGEDLISNAINTKTIWEEHIVNELVTYYKEGTDILDIGANIGLNSLRLNQLKKITGTCHLFEPQSDVFLLLDYNTRDINRKLYNMALSDTCKIFSYNQNKKNIGATVLANNKDGMIYTNSIPLDSIEFNNEISVIKIDVEGGEIDVLKGGRNFLNKYKPVIVIEIWKDNVDKLIQELNSQNYIQTKHLGADDYVFEYKK